jgi:hypothetical protein
MEESETPARGDCDAFLSYSSQERSAARELKLKLEVRGLTIWFDQDRLRPGLNWQEPLQRALQQSGSIIVTIGGSGIGRWQNEEMQAALRAAVALGRPVIPVLLPGSPSEDTVGAFLLNRTCVDLRDGYSEYQIDRLVWGIKGEKPGLNSQTGGTQSGAATGWILVAGSGGKKPVPGIAQTVSRRLGEALATAGFSLVTGGWNGVDEYVARAFAEQIQHDGQTLSGRLVQIMQSGARPQFPAGRLDSAGSEDDAWKRSIRRADAVVLVGGLGGTYQTAEWAEQLGKFVFPLADTRGPDRDHADAYKFYFTMLENWSRTPLSKLLTEDEFCSMANAAPGVVSDLIRLLRRLPLRTCNDATP